MITEDQKRSSASTSTLDVLWTRYGQILPVGPDRVDDPERDGSVLFKGHGPASHHAVLAAEGFIVPQLFAGLGSFGSPERLLIPGVEVSSRFLGHGLLIVVGIALGLRIQGRTGLRVVCLLGNGELDEGSNYEAIVLASRFGLSSLTAIVIENDSADLHGYGTRRDHDRAHGLEAPSLRAQIDAFLETPPT